MPHGGIGYDFPAGHPYWTERAKEEAARERQYRKNMKEANRPLSPSDFVVRVDRSSKPDYGHLGLRNTEVVHPKLECLGPAEFNLWEDVWLWSPGDLAAENKAEVSGSEVYEYLERTNALPSCLNLQDGRALQKKGVGVFWKRFGEHAHLLLFGSVVRQKNNLGSGYTFLVPFLFGHHSGVLMNWHELSRYSSLNTYQRVLRFR